MQDFQEEVLSFFDGSIILERKGDSLQPNKPMLMREELFSLELGKQQENKEEGT